MRDVLPNFTVTGLLSFLLTQCATVNTTSSAINDPPHLYSILLSGNDGYPRATWNGNSPTLAGFRTTDFSIEFSTETVYFSLHKAAENFFDFGCFCVSPGV